MMKKITLILSSIFLIKLFISSCSGFLAPKNCPILERLFNELELSTFDISGEEEKEIDQAISKTDFRIYVDALYKSTLIGKLELKKNNHLNSIGFNKVYAEDCDTDIIYLNEIDSINIFAIDFYANTIENVTNNFKYLNFNNEYIDYNENIDLLQLWHDTSMSISTPLDLIIEDNIPNNAVFKVNLYLNSGDVFIQETAFIEFIP